MVGNTLRIVSSYWVTSKEKEEEKAKIFVPNINNVVFHCPNKNYWQHGAPLSDSRAKFYVSFSSYQNGNL
jgi:hypothetical protein